MQKVTLCLFLALCIALCNGYPRERRQVVNAAVDTSKSVGHGGAAAGSAITLQDETAEITVQDETAERQVSRAIDRAGDAADAAAGDAAPGDATDVGHAVYNPHKP